MYSFSIFCAEAGGACVFITRLIISPITNATVLPVEKSRLLFRLVRFPKQPRERGLKTLDEKICLATALSEFFDLRVLRGNLSAQKFHFAFQSAE